MATFTKTILAQYLRTRCEKQLYLALRSDQERDANQLPPPLKLRPQIQLITAAGRDWEAEKYRELQAAFGTDVSGLRPDGTKHNNVQLVDRLERAGQEDTFIVEATMSHPNLRDRVAQNLALDPGQVNQLPAFGEFRPDIVWIRRRRRPGQLAVRSGGVLEFTPDDDQRLPLSIIDVKHAATGNASYSSEVALYSLVLANWLELTGLDDRFYAAADFGLWTKPHQVSALGSALAVRANKDTLLLAFENDIEWVPGPQFLPTVRDFLSDTLPRVNGKPFDQLEWHVDSRCSACDWLAQEEWVTRDRDRAQVAASGQYCHSRARITEHLSRVATLGRGARRTLETGAVRSLAQLAALPADAPQFQRHNRLKADAEQLPIRADVVRGARQLTITPTIRADIARYVDLQVFIAVNFDAGADLLTGIGVRAWFRPSTPRGQQASETRQLPATELVVDLPTLESEGEALLSVLRLLGSYFQYARDPATGGPQPHLNGTQIYFWDERQYVELTRAIGRHLGVILSDDTVRGLAWIFPPEDLLPSPENAAVPAVAFIKPAVLEAVSADIPHAYTLFSVVQCFHATAPQGIPNSYYRDPLSDMIPRERIYEIWHRAAHPVGWQDVMQRYRATIRQQVFALAQITWKLKSEANCTGTAPVLKLDGLTSYQRMSADGRVWYAWTLLDDNLLQLNATLAAVGRPALQEANYECIRLIGPGASVGPSRVRFRVHENSLNSKFTDGESFLALRCDDIPAFLLLAVNQIPGAVPTGYQGDWTRDGYLRNRRVFGDVSVIQFDRAARTIELQLNTFGSAPNLRLHLAAVGAVNFRTGNWSLVRGPGVPLAPTVREVLLGIGAPRIAVPHPSSLRIYGNLRPPAPRNSPEIRAARLLWRAAEQQQLQVGIPLDATDRHLQTFGEDRLDQSQRTAVRDAALRSLCLIWGPPGTGKTTTLAALLTCEILEAIATGRHTRILVTGPTYRALSELCARLISHADRVLGIASFMFARTFSSSRPLPNDINQPSSVLGELADCHTTTDDRNYNRLLDELRQPTMPVVVFSTPRQATRIVKHLHNGNLVAEVFDRCLIDESSQVTVSHALLAFGALGPDARVTIAGDSLQLPPISAAAAPLGAEFLVGSIHRYFKDGYQVPETPLLVNYRSSASFVRFAHRLGYPRQLISHYPRQRINLDPRFATEAGASWPEDVVFGPWLNEVLSPQRELVTVLHHDQISGQFNPFEGHIVAALCAQLRETLSRDLHQGENAPVVAHTDESFWTDGIGVVTPHRSQRVAILNSLLKLFPGTDPDLIGSAIDTVEKFQGGERQVIIISFGVGDPDLIADEEEFLLQLERTNVAVSRARAKCICLISRDLAYHLPESQKAVDTSLALKTLIFDECSASTRSECVVEEEHHPIEVRYSGEPIDP